MKTDIPISGRSGLSISRPAFIFFFACFFCVGLFAQTVKTKKTMTTGKIRLENFEVNESDPKHFKVLQSPQLNFHNINKVAYFHDAKALAHLNKLQKHKKWEELHTEMLKYVESFGVDNFMKDIDMLWHLARTSEFLGKTELTKEVYRVIIKHHRGHLQEALHHYDSLAKFDKEMYVDLDYYFHLVEVRKAIDTLAPPEGIQLNMGESINSKYEDYGLAIVDHDRLLYFTSKRLQDTTKVGKAFPKLNEDIYFSTRTDEGEWDKAMSVKEINTPFNEGSPCLTEDGQILMFARCGSPDGKGNCDIYETEYSFEKARWSPPKNLGDMINGYAWDSHPALSFSADTLYFASDRRGGFGGSDIYYSVKGPKGEWGLAQNMGPTINTIGDEASPHIKNDVLYFSSTGQMLNYGDFDIYKSYMTDGKWTEPKNIGPLVNGPGQELYFSIDDKAKHLYYARSEGHDIKNLDLHSFPMPMEAKPDAFVRFTGKVVEPSTGEVFKGVVTVIDLKENVEVTPRHLREDGTFEFDLINNRKYLLLIEGDNFFKIEEAFVMNGDKDKVFETKDINKVVAFTSIDFESGSANLKPEMENNLHLLIEFLVTHPEYNLDIMGHTDNDGNPKANLILSHDRAESIKKYIVAYGRLDDWRVKAEGFGNTQPIIPNPSSEDDKKINRRVEFKVYKNPSLDKDIEKSKIKEGGGEGDEIGKEAEVVDGDGK